MTATRRYVDHDACGIALVADVAGRSSHELFASGLEALRRLAHRGSSGRCGATSDGCGVLTNIPWRLLDREGAPPPVGLRALGAFFVAPDAQHALMAIVEPLVRAAGWKPRRWRNVPVDPAVLGTQERASAPLALHLECVWKGGTLLSGRRSLWRLRLQIRHHLATAGIDAVVVSLSADTVVYKGLVTPNQLPRFYADLVDPRFDASTVVVHQRFSTNTSSHWALVQPFHVLGHNGEINTIDGNRARMRARSQSRRVLGLRETGDLAPMVATDGSDSESLDDAVGLLCATGASLPRAVARLLPPAWEHETSRSASVRAMLAWDVMRTEPWEGPAAVVFTNGVVSGATLDSNGFRPLRWLRTTDGWVVVASEAGVVDIPEAQVAERRRVGPGDMLVVDAAAGVIHTGATARGAWAREQPYADWVRRGVLTLPRRSPVVRAETMAELRPLHRRYGYDREEIEMVLRPMVRDGVEAVGSMGDDTAPAALSVRPRLMHDYFRQRFAQVTNPPIDALREARVMSLTSWLGAAPALRDGAPTTAVIRLDSPILDATDMATLSAHVVRLDATWVIAEGRVGFTRALSQLAADAVRSVCSGVSVLVVSDIAVTPERAALPAPLALASVLRGLEGQGLMAEASVVVESGEPRDAHHVAVLTSLGARAVCPHLAFRTAAALGGDDSVGAQARLRTALEQGLLKVMAKMGASTFGAYCGATLVETLGLDADLTQQYFPGVRGVPGGVTLGRLHEDTAARHREADVTDSANAGELTHVGFHGFRKGGDYHAFNPDVVKALHRTSRTDAAVAYTHFAQLVAERPATAVRDLLTFAPSVAVDASRVEDDVEAASSICRRFFASAMSVGALSPEAHSVVAGAMNQLGGRGNSGEGGEDPARAWPRRGPGSTNSAIKQVASGRFGVTPAYLISADELQIKMAQGSKPGEGGQLPAKKVTEHIAWLRHTRPGTALISPPPHHDIYSIEDLAQLIHDLQSFHPTARISVKLVATSGIGVIAAGVVKAGAHAIQISGHDGGTGASPRGSIKSAGMPWEYGLSEVHRVLTERGLRSHVALQVDGGCKTGVDVVKAAALGADEIGFGTSLLVAAGCVMARQCHADTCPVGIATQRVDLRAKFDGTSEHVAQYLGLVAAHVRQLMARLGVRRFDELVGRRDLLVPVRGDAQARLALGDLLAPVVTRATRAAITDHAGGVRTLNDRVVDACLPRLGRAPILWSSPIANTDLSVGARLAGVIAERYGDAGSPETIRLQFAGTAGQSFGAFTLPGVHMGLTGEANDGVGKSMHGGLIVIAPRRRSRPRRDVIIGNSALYGATGGTAFIAGEAGERFGVRNSGATAVVEGVGDHGCEYMTGGVVVVLGPVGRNFGAGMTGGLALVLASASRLASMLHAGSVVAMPPSSHDLEVLRTLVERHEAATRSHVAQGVLRRWAGVHARCRVVLPLADSQLRRMAPSSDDGVPWTYASLKS